MAFQYAAKFICGLHKSTPGLAHGTYQTDINVHNPGKDVDSFQFKLAVAGEAADGTITPFKDARIKADGAQFFACETVHKIFGLPPTQLIDGFFVIQSKLPLDVIAVYTTNDLAGNGVPAIAVERVFERVIP
jgi:hypothetical protein